MGMLYRLAEFWAEIAGVLVLGVTVVATGHVLLNKRDSKAATGWIGVIWLSPLLGSVLYVLFGINRIRRRAAVLRNPAARKAPPQGACACKPSQLAALLPDDKQHLAAIAVLGDRVNEQPLLTGNRLTPLEDGEVAYAEMLEAIEGARRSVALSTYIFAGDKSGERFARALGRAVERGAEVRVLIDDVGSAYSWPGAAPLLRRRKVPLAHFLPTLIPWHVPYLNLRNHRKLLVVDGRLGFTGGMNIQDGHALLGRKEPRIQDLHFQVEGPIVEQLLEVFADDWRFTTGEALRGEPWFPRLAPVGTVVARGIADGPDEDFEKLRWTLLGAVETATSSIQIVTPYFLPDSALMTSLSVAALTGIQVDIVLPAKNNLRIVQWAAYPILAELAANGCRVWMSPPPFDHAKLMVVDEAWVLVGSGNWDPRSLRLNFEFNLECYDRQLAGRLASVARRKIASAKPLTLQQLKRRPLPLRLRDGAARLLTPYL